jgi:hypothetical protein
VSARAGDDVLDAATELVEPASIRLVMAKPTKTTTDAEIVVMSRAWLKASLPAWLMIFPRGPPVY